MKKIMNFKTIVLALGVLLSGLAFAAEGGDVNLSRVVSGSDVLKTGASTTTDVCECNTVGGTLFGTDAGRYDHVLAIENPKDNSGAAGSQGAGAVDGPAGQ